MDFRAQPTSSRMKALTRKTHGATNVALHSATFDATHGSHIATVGAQCKRRILQVASISFMQDLALDWL